MTLSELSTWVISFKLFAHMSSTEQGYPEASALIRSRYWESAAYVEGLAQIFRFHRGGVSEI